MKGFETISIFASKGIVRSFVNAPGLYFYRDRKESTLEKVDLLFDTELPAPERLRQLER
ncbi:MAG: hypothetical protein ACI4V3_06445 [Faecousia sp.]